VSARRGGAIRRVRAGLTLMEITVTLAIIGMVAATAATAFSMIVRADGQLKAASVQVERAAALRDLIRQWITTGTITPDSAGIAGQTSIGSSGGRGGRGGGSVQATATPGDSTGVTTAQGIGDELRFTTSAVTPAEAPNVIVRLFICDDMNAPEHGLTMEYQPSTSGNTAGPEPLRRIQLDTTIGNITVMYLDGKTQMWFPAAQVATIAPVAVKFTLGPIDSTVPYDSLSHLLYLPFIFRMGDPQDSLNVSTTSAGRGGAGGAAGAGAGGAARGAGGRGGGG